MSTQINPAFDVVVWGAAFLFLALLGARAWVVETGSVRTVGTTATVKVLTAAAVVTAVAVAVLLWIQGGQQLIALLLSGTPVDVVQPPAPPG